MKVLSFELLDKLLLRLYLWFKLFTLGFFLSLRLRSHKYNVSLLFCRIQNLLNHWNEIRVLIMMHDKSEKEFLVRILKFVLGVSLNAEKNILQNRNLYFLLNKILVHQKPKQRVLNLEVIMFQNMENKLNQIFPIFFHYLKLNLQNLIQNRHWILEQYRITAILNIANSLDKFNIFLNKV